jgi:hypothetical protein
VIIRLSNRIKDSQAIALLMILSLAIVTSLDNRRASFYRLSGLHSDSRTSDNDGRCEPMWYRRVGLVSDKHDAKYADAPMKSQRYSSTQGFLLLNPDHHLPPICPNQIMLLTTFFVMNVLRPWFRPKMRYFDHQTMEKGCNHLFCLDVYRHFRLFKPMQGFNVESGI